MRPRQALLPVLLALLWFAIPACASPPEDQPQARVTYLGNEGFLIESGGQRVLIDALHGDGIPPYVALPAPHREKIETAKPPFDNIDLILASHHHDDHFSAAGVARHLEANPETHFASTNQAASKLRKLMPDNSNRVHGLYPAKGKREKVSGPAVGLEVMPFHHGSGRDVENLGLLVTIGEIKILHVGDTEASPAEFKRWGMAEEELDIAFVPYWFIGKPGWRESLAKTKQIVAMHIPAANAGPPYFSPDRDLGALRTRLKAEGVFSFAELMQRQSFPLEN